VSLGKFVTLGGEVPVMVMIEAISRLLPWVIKEESSRQDESYRPELGGENIEYPQYTRPEVVEGMYVPEVLLSGHHAQIDTWRRQNQQHCN
jgi:tRNA (guanine37-N1)-methyltransferase